MRIERAVIKNFRLLENVDITFEPVSTVIVGRNNSGKTSLTEVFDRLIGDKAGQFKLEDFSSSALQKFLDAKKLQDGGTRSDTVLVELPVISVELTVRYDRKEADFGPLSDFIIDLDTDCMQIPMHRGHLLRFDRGQATDLMAATIPI
jgi:putative ATP-dependent endonuclease of the OLD family